MIDINEDNSPLWELLGKVLSGEANKYEMEEFDKWLHLSSENGKIWEEVKGGMEDIDYAVRLEEVDVEMAWSKVKAQACLSSNEQKVERGRFKIRRKWYGVAAAVALLFMVVNYWFSFDPQRHLAASVVEVSQFDRESVVLADGTNVVINGNSKFLYPDDFVDTIRNVNLEGEAFFDVAPDAAKPFVISAGRVTIKVLGTSFNVKAYPKQNKTEVVVRSGVVQVAALNGEESRVVITAGEKAIWDSRSGKVLMIKNADQNYLAWKTREIEFQKTPMTQVIDVLENVYKVNVEVRDKLILKKRLTASFSHDSFDFVLRVICETFNLKYKKEEGVVVLEKTFAGV